MTERFERLRVHGLLRSAIIGYGIAAYWLLAPASAAGAGYRYMLLIGIGVQLGVLVARKLVSALPSFIFELFADGITVLLFAAATYGSLLRYVGEL